MPRLKLPQAVKSITNPLIGRIPIRIRSGPNAGARWSLASAGSGYGAGTRERAQLEVLSKLIRPGDVVWDVGAHYGYVTLCAARAVGAEGSVHAFEPGLATRWFLERHVRWNNLTNVIVYPYALGAFDGTSNFGGGSTSKQNRLGEGGEVVQVRTIGFAIDSNDVPAPDFVKIDIEGAEGDLLGNGLSALGPGVRLLIALHSPELYDRCTALLADAGFRTFESARLQRYRTERWKGDADLVAFGPWHERAEEDLAMLAEVGY